MGANMKCENWHSDPLGGPKEVGTSYLKIVFWFHTAAVEMALFMPNLRFSNSLVLTFLPLRFPQNKRKTVNLTLCK